MGILSALLLRIANVLPATTAKTKMCRS